jgi:hypothetical protein
MASSSALGIRLNSTSNPADVLSVSPSASGSKISGTTSMEADTFDIVGAYEKALQDDQVGWIAELLKELKLRTSEPRNRADLFFLWARLSRSLTQ